jgi:hypothetical protein
MPAFKQLALQFIAFLLMSLIDDITKFIVKFCSDTKTKFQSYCQQKVIETIENPNKKHMIIENSVPLNIKHDTSKYSMQRVYNISHDSKSSNQDNDNQTSNIMVDSLLVYICKLSNIPNFKLINNGKIIIDYMTKPIQITRDIFVKIDLLNKTETGDISMIKLSLLSNTLTSSELVEFVNDLYDKYKQELKNSLGNKIYYFDQKNSQTSMPPRLPVTGSGADSKINETNHRTMLINSAPKQLSFTKELFYSNKQFDNLFGQDVKYIKKRVEFFINNKEWYDSKSLPHQLGILLSGIPGTSKSSCIKAIANLTKRHIINVNFGNITTATQLKNLFYSDQLSVYGDSNLGSRDNYYIPIDQRLYVFEEIDAAGDILKQRNKSSIGKSVVNDELTLMEILTLLDGTQEIPGRLIIFTTNHPEFLDKALIRPGRIDINIRFGYANRSLIAEMFKGYFDQDFPNEEYDNIPDMMLSPAEVSQVFLNYFDNFEDNIKNIVQDLHNICVKQNRICEEKSPCSNKSWSTTSSTKDEIMEMKEIEKEQKEQENGVNDIECKTNIITNSKNDQNIEIQPRDFDQRPMSEIMAECNTRVEFEKQQQKTKCEILENNSQYLSEKISKDEVPLPNVDMRSMVVIMEEKNKIQEVEILKPKTESIVPRYDSGTWGKQINEVAFTNGAGNDILCFEAMHKNQYGLIE